MLFGRPNFEDRKAFAGDRFIAGDIDIDSILHDLMHAGHAPTKSHKRLSSIEEIELEDDP